MTQYRIDIDGSTFSELQDVSAISTINPFGDRYVLTLNDSEGDKFNQIQPNAPAEIFAREPTKSGDADNAWESQFVGYVVESRELQEGNRDKLEVWVYSYDQLLRNERVSANYRDNTIFEALEGIITNDTPATWNASNVAVEDDRNLERSLEGVAVEDALSILSRKSANERYGVSDTQEFFFNPREESSADRDVTDSDVVNWDIPERAKESKNAVTVWYNNGDDKVEVSRGGEQLRVQDALGTDSPVPFPDEINRPTITTREEATDAGRSFLRQREDTLTGEVMCVGEFGFLSNAIGDTVDVTITPRGVDDEFVIVSKEVNYLEDTITFGIVEKRGEQDSLLKEIGKQVKREELSDTDRSSDTDTVTQTEIRVGIERDWSNIGTVASERVTTTNRNVLRDVWRRGERTDTTPEIDTAILGSADSISKATETVPNQVDTSTVSLSEPVSDTVRVDLSLTGTGNVIGLEDTENRLLFIARFDAEITDPSGTVDITINDESPPNGVLTTVGQGAISDFYRGNALAAPAKVGYGSDNTEPQESDNALGTPQITRAFDDFQIFDVTTTSEWNDVLATIDISTPLAVDEGIKHLQSAWVVEAEDNFDGVNFRQEVGFSNGDAALVANSGDRIEFEVTPGYELPAENAVLAARGRKDGDQGLYDIAINSFQVANERATQFDTTIGWEEIWADFQLDLDTIQNGDEISIDLMQEGQTMEDVWDVVVLYDDRYDHSVAGGNTFDNSVHQDNGYLEDPFLHAAPFDATISNVSFPQLSVGASLGTNYNDISNGQLITILGNLATIAENSETVDASFSERLRSVDVIFRLDGYGENGSQTPRQRFNGQTVSSATLTADFSVLNISDVGRADIEAYFDSDIVNGLTLAEAGQLTTGDDALTRSVFPELNPSGGAVVFSEDIGFDIT